MGSAVVQLLVLAGIAIFLILKLKDVLGTRDGFEKPPLDPSERAAPRRRARDFEVIEGGADRDITDHVPENSNAAKALTQMKKIESDFNVGEFLQGARGAYEMILMAFENGDLEEIEDFLGDEVRSTFIEVIAMREDQGLKVEAEFVGLREISLTNATFDESTKEAEVSVRFIGELTSVVRNDEGEIVEGNPNEIKRQRDVWTFARVMGSDDPNWRLVATAE
ncbi:MAG: Tim44 domain-containing protein [Rhodobacteraceae bacterium]|nr:Tim44 domain-containing protein [Paracoccaceae bacterium]